ncbi:uncharacterized protein LACBIDRAFT_322344 [Laccaria bicolor S238N-H82]|uniref:Predicted protein n=1 Tax=Laccaria bicolor (strain S238N-H82 / ATCC MYA-4686) TaxID=486041 RepID=B0CSZ2_LACBS|nr:uncharacterized protein LACBIDRAFT_322344 [Laccaria bicolor S238N-H82]EDR14922.1 predicted protein [Laccaria bicolor S238N-H82]|eukprot:XP_001875481.1 predicted protein [Laccaria bicolor S238N-H82]
MDNVKSTSLALKNVVEKQKHNADIEDSLAQLSSITTLLEFSNTPPKSFQRLSHLLRNRLMALYLIQFALTLQFSTSILLVVRDVKIKAAEEAGDEKMKQSWELVLISLLSGILDYLECNAVNGDRIVAGDTLYPVLCRLYFSRPSTEISEISSVLLSTSYLNSRTVESSAKIVFWADFLAIEALLELFANLLPSTKPKGGQEKRSQFISEVLNPSFCACSEVVVEILTSLSTSEWDAVSLRIIDALGRSDITFPQPFDVSLLTISAVTKTIDRLYVDNQGLLASLEEIAVHRISQKLSKAELQIEFDLDKALPRPTQEKVESIAKRESAMRVIPHVCTDALPVWDREISPSQVGQIEPTSPLVSRLLSPAPLGPEEYSGISMPAHTTVFLDRHGNLSFNPVPVEESTEPSMIPSRKQAISPAEKSSSRASPKRPISIVSPEHEGADQTPFRRARLMNKRAVLSDDESVVDNPIGYRKIAPQVNSDLSATVPDREDPTALNRNPAKGKELDLLPTFANPASKMTAENNCTSAQGTGKILITLKVQDKVEPLDKQLVEERPMKRNRQNIPPLGKIPPSPSVASRAKRYGKRARASPVPAAPREDLDEPPKLAAHQKIKTTAAAEVPIRKIIMKGKDGKSNVKSVPAKGNAKLKEKKPFTDKGIVIKAEPVVDSLDVPFSLRTSPNNTTGVLDPKPTRRSVRVASALDRSATSNIPVVAEVETRMKSSKAPWEKVDFTRKTKENFKPSPTESRQDYEVQQSDEPHSKRFHLNVNSGTERASLIESRASDPASISSERFDDIQKPKHIEYSVPTKGGSADEHPKLSKKDVVMIDLTQGVTPERKQSSSESSKDSNMILSPLRPHKFERMPTLGFDLTLPKPVTHQPKVGLGGIKQTSVETEWHAYRQTVDNTSPAEKLFGKQTYSKGPTDAIVKVTAFPSSCLFRGSKKE